MPPWARRRSFPRRPVDPPRRFRRRGVMRNSTTFAAAVSSTSKNSAAGRRKPRPRRRRASSSPAALRRRLAALRNGSIRLVNRRGGGSRIKPDLCRNPRRRVRCLRRSAGRRHRTIPRFLGSLSPHRCPSLRRRCSDRPPCRRYGTRWKPCCAIAARSDRRSFSRNCWMLRWLCGRRKLERSERWTRPSSRREQRSIRTTLQRQPRASGYFQPTQQSHRHASANGHPPRSAGARGRWIPACEGMTDRAINRPRASERDARDTASGYTGRP